MRDEHSAIDALAFVSLVLMVAIAVCLILDALLGQDITEEEIVELAPVEYAYGR